MKRLIFGLIVLTWTFAGAQLPRGFLHGGDVSEIPEVEASGAHYSYKGVQEDPFVLMKQAGWNFVRFRVWNDPKGGWCDKAHTLEMSRRAKAQGLKISLDFHYSDWWADPGKQFKPAAWKDLPFDKLVTALYDYTKDVVSAMVAQGTPPVMVQVGNEITAGTEWPDGKLNSNDPEQWRKLSELLKAGIQAVHDAQGRNHIATMIHLDRGGDEKGAQWWFDHAIADGVKFDLIGLSYYPFWHGHIDAMQANVDSLARRYNKDIYIVETAYPWRVENHGSPEGTVFDGKRGIENGFPPTPEGQAGILKKEIEIILNIPGHHGKGILYWAPTWISPPGRSAPYNNMATFDEKGNALPAVDVLGGKRN